ncbi:MAG: hypothetical protein ABIA78_01340 [archaeon]
MIGKYPCDSKCKAGVDVVKIPYEDERIEITLMVCSECKGVIALYLNVPDDFPFSESLKVRDEMVKRYGLDAIA